MQHTKMFKRFDRKLRQKIFNYLNINIKYFELYSNKFSVNHIYENKESDIKTQLLTAVHITNAVTLTQDQ